MQYYTLLLIKCLWQYSVIIKVYQIELFLHYSMMGIMCGGILHGSWLFTYFRSFITFHFLQYVFKRLQL